MGNAIQSKKVITERVAELDRRKNLLRIDRKIEFLLDVRGYFIVNGIKGNYVEFGCYNGEMLFAALKVFGPKRLCRSFVGLDTFEGEPVLVNNDAEHNTFNVKGDYCSPLEAVNKLVADESCSVKLIKGDFRKAAVRSRLEGAVKRGGINISVIDCNILSSIESSTEFTFKHIKDGGFLFVDDFYTNMAKGRMPVRNILLTAAAKYGKRLHHYRGYPPFAEAFIILDGCCQRKRIG